MSKKILFVGVFNPNSTNWSQAESFERLNCEVIRFNYREEAYRHSAELMNQKLKALCEMERPDLTVFAKANPVANSVVKKCSKLSVTCMWYCDPYPMGGWQNILGKVKLCHFTCCDKVKAVKAAKQITEHAYHVVEGYDALRDRQIETEQILDVSFIGQLKKDGRERRLNKLIGLLGKEAKLSIFQDAYGEKHAEIVSKSKINLNLCTRGCASDRVYKTLAAGGFLLSDEWAKRNKMFEDGKHLVIFDTLEDLKEKILHYLAHDEDRQRIAEAGRTQNEQYNRDNWALGIIQIYEKFVSP